MYGLLVSCMMCFTLILLDYIQYFIHLFVFSRVYRESYTSALSCNNHNFSCASSYFRIYSLSILFLIDFTAIPLADFLRSRLLPTIIANALFLMILGWAFKYLINARVLQRAREVS